MRISLVNSVSFFAAVMAVILLTSCARITNGVQIEIGKLDKVKLNMTTREEVVEMFGKPQTTVINKLEEITTYQYKYITTRSCAIPIVPGLPLITFGKGADNGYLLNIAIRDGLVVNYELTLLENRLK